MSGDPPRGLDAFQSGFGAVLRTPLDRATGTLTATPDRYDRATLEASLDGPRTSGAERLAVYNRQYWCRLFDVLHTAFPLTCRLVGYWSFNAWAGRYFEAHPPRGWDVDAVADPFAAWFAVDLGAPNVDGERLAWIEAARIDASYRDVFRAPRVAPFRPSPEDAARLLDMQLVTSPAVAIVEEHSALLDLRRVVMRDATERAFAPPSLWPAQRSVALVRGEEGTFEFPLEAREADLLRLLGDHPVREALARVEHDCPAEDRGALAEGTGRWLARSVERGWWMRST